MVDETRVSRNSTNSNIKYVVASEQKNGSFIVPNTLSTLSAVVFITASGHTLLIVHVLPDNSINEENDDIVVENDEARSSRCMRGSIMNVAICKTKSGWVTKKAWKAMIHYFSKISKNWLNGRHGFITMDRLACHGDNESITALKNIGLECVYFPAHTSHFIQPLDQTAFALLKRYFKIEFIRLSIMMYLNNKSNDGIMNVAICKTKSGWVTKKAWKAMIHYFSKISKNWLNGRHGFITMDRLACHGDNESITALKNIGLECVYFPAHTSHFIQPLDQTAFALLKRYFKIEFIRLSIMMYLNNKSNDDIIRSALIQAEVLAYTHINIKAGFDKAGIYPWQPKKIQSISTMLSGNDVDISNTTPQEEKAMKVWNQFIKDRFEMNRPLVPRQTRKRRISNNIFTGTELLEKDRRREREKDKKDRSRLFQHSRKKKIEILKVLNRIMKLNQFK